ncbi:MAG: hypothetical protein EHM42_06675 [Planctomycetaceae bacterium]|nr:MAG: hypothetical protein EHM42_06675 [Planctomycetaceae bacterium]
MPTFSNRKTAANPIVPPQELAGQWIAWNRHRTAIIAHGFELKTVHDAAIAQGQPDALLEVVQPIDRLLIG